MENVVKEEEKLGEIGKDMLRTLRRFEEKKRWRTIKVRKLTYNQINIISALLGIEKYKVVDLSILVLRLLLTDKLVLPQREVGLLELGECVDKYEYDEEKKIGWAELDPSCVLKKLIVPFYQKKQLIENLINNLESLDKF